METTNDTPTYTNHPGASPLDAPDLAAQEAESDILAEKAAMSRRSTTSRHHDGRGGDAQARMNVLVQMGVLGDGSTTEQSDGINRVRASNTSACTATGSSSTGIRRTSTISSTSSHHQDDPFVSDEAPTEQRQHQSTNPTKDSSRAQQSASYHLEKVGAKGEEHKEGTRLQMDVLLGVGVLAAEDPTKRSAVVDEARVPGSPQPTVSMPGAHRAFPSFYQETSQNEGQESEDPPSPCLEEGVLAQARPVDELEVPHQSAELLDLEEHRASIKQKQQKHISATLQLVLAGLLLLLLVVIGLTVGLTRLNENSSSPEVSINSGPPQLDAEPTPSPTSWTWDLPFTIPNSTLSFLYHDTEQTSPQFKAYKWMKQDPYLSYYPEARLLQRFVLVTFYYATRGETWTHQGGGIITVEAPAFSTLTEFTPNQTMPPLPHHPSPQDPNISNNNHGSETPKREIVQYNLTSEQWLSYEHSECDWFSTGLVSPYRRPACDEEGIFQQLDLASNNLQGTLPPELGILTTLKVIGLGRNNIGGPLFTEIGNLRKLEGIHLSSKNQVTGSLPSEIGLLSDTLRTISLSSNQLSGTIPTEFWQLSNLNEIKLSLNKLSGTLPSNIGHFLPNLKQLLLGLSDLSGTIPTSLGLLTGLVHLDLGDSQFVGSIPTELGKLELLTRLAVHENQLSGQVPSELGLLPFLRDLWLPQNAGITGQLPTSLEKLNGTLGSLRIAGTGIAGTIPAALCGIDEMLFDCSETLCGCQMCPCQEQ